MPEREQLAAFAATGATLALHLSIHVVEQACADLVPFYGPDVPAAVVFRATWPDERVLTGTLTTLPDRVRAERIERTALILVGPALDPSDFRESALYAPDYDRRFRPQGAVNAPGRDSGRDSGRDAGEVTP